MSTDGLVRLVKKSGNHSPPSNQLGRRRDSATPSLTIHQVADSTWEERAVCYFFDQYTSGGDPDEAISYLSFLPSLYATCRDNGPESSTTASALRLAVDATSLMALGTDVHSPSLTLRARGCYGSALRGLRQALTTQTQAVKDETFAAMVLLALFEDITGERNGLASSHAAGFELLLKLRGEAQLENAQGRDLFNFAYTHTHVEILALREKPRYNTDWIAESLSGADPVARLILIASKLSQLFLATSPLQASALTFTSLDTNITDQLSLLLLTGRQIDLELTSWSQDLPERWLPIVISPDKADTHNPLITYHHLSIASIWTYYRAVRIVSHLIMFELRRGLAAATGAVPEDPNPPAIIQNMIADICHSIPFCLGDVDVSGNSTTSFSSASSTGSSKPKPRARAFPVYSMIWPLWYIFTSGLATPSQEDHIQASLAKIGSVLGIKLASVLAEDAAGQRRDADIAAGAGGKKTGHHNGDGLANSVFEDMKVKFKS
ncbi:hypothetical protein BJX99DRAFT_251870 [Aspergillus californicus]